MPAPKAWRVPILVSYAYWSKQIERLLRRYEGCYRLILDSGAFTVFKQGKAIDLDEYCAFLKNPPVKLDRYFVLDIVGDPAGTRRNWDKMLSLGLNPIPIFTGGTSPKVAEEMWKKSDLVALGGMAQVPGGTRKPFPKWFDETVRRGRRVHWLGFTDEDFIRHYKPYSCDTSNWGEAARYGRLRVFSAGRLLPAVARKDFFRNVAAKREAKRFGLFDQLCEKAGWCWTLGKLQSASQALTTCSYLKLAQHVEAGMGTQYYLASDNGGGGTGLAPLIRCWRRVVVDSDTDLFEKEEGV